MKKTIKTIFILGASILFLSGCGTEKTKENENFSVGIMLSDAGLGDQSFSDTGFKGLIKARDELGIEFDYKEIKETGTYEKGIEELTNEGHDLIIGLGFSVQEDMEKVAKKYPKQKYVLVDSVSDEKNITNITFKEEEGSYLIGILAGMKTKSNKIGFIGGLDNELINKFAAGFKQGVLEINPNAQVIIEYADGFGNDKLGAQMADEMIKNGVDVIYPAAGFTGFGSLKKAQEKGIYAFGVDTDQYFIAEKAIISSMLKNVDVAIYEIVKSHLDGKQQKDQIITLGLKENGVDIAPIRISPITAEQQVKIETLKQDVIDGKIKVEAELGGK